MWKKYKYVRLQIALTPLCDHFYIKVDRSTMRLVDLGLMFSRLHSLPCVSNYVVSRQTTTLSTHIRSFL